MRYVQYIIYVFIVLQEGKSIYDENQTKIKLSVTSIPND